MKFDCSFFQDEIREGFYIPGMIKRSWAEQMEVLNVIREVCEKYKITWFADCGTMLGAVRHKGFIPWDDDIDICMFRDEYKRFNQIIVDELPAGYKVNNFDTEPEYDLFLTRIVSNTEINMSNEYLRNHNGFPYIAGIDIVPLDYLYPDEEEEKKRRAETLKLWTIAEKYYSGTLNEKEVKESVFQVTGNHLDNELSVKGALIRLIEKKFSEYNGTNSTQVVPMHDYIRNGTNRQNIAWYKNIVEIPFENDFINVPAAYEKLLTERYGANWSIANKSAGSHDYPFFAKYEKMLFEKKSYIPYVYFHSSDEERIQRRAEHKKNIDYIWYCVGCIVDLHNCFRRTFEDQIDESINILEKCQEIAIEVGTEIENKYGMGTDIVSLLENYCEFVYSLGQNMDFLTRDEIIQFIDGLDKTIESICEGYFGLIGKTKKILFIPARYKDWKYMKNLYDDYVNSKNAEIFIMPAYYADRSDDGSLMEMHTDIGLFSQDMNIMDANSVDLSKYHFEEIVITTPFDEYGSGFSVHPLLYSTKLFEYTDKLTYCQCFEVDEIHQNDMRALDNASHYVIMPGVMLADKIYVPNNNTKEVYQKIISKHYPKCIKDNIEVLYQNNEDMVKNTNKRILLFNVSLSDIISYEGIVEKVNDCIDIFEKYKGDMDIIWTEDILILPKETKEFSGLFEQYEKLKQRFSQLKIGNIEELSNVCSKLGSVSAYYGSAGYLMNLCYHKKIPTMLWKK